MPEKLKMADLIAAEKAATPGTWITANYSEEQYVDFWVSSEDGGVGFAGCEEGATATFIALSRNALPALIEIAKAAQGVDEHLCSKTTTLEDGFLNRLTIALSAIDWEGVEEKGESDGS